MNTLESKEARLEMAVAAEKSRATSGLPAHYEKLRPKRISLRDVRGGGCSRADCAEVDLLYLEPGRTFPTAQQTAVEAAVPRACPGDWPTLKTPGLLNQSSLRRTTICSRLSARSIRIRFMSNAIRGWKERCGTSVCWIDELWGNRVPQYNYWLPLLREFDHVILEEIRGSVEAVSNAIGRRCHYVPGGVDALRFSPYPNPPARVIDVYSIGRRSEQIPQGLLELASGKQIFYVHDTLQNVSDNQTLDYRAHRDLYANMAKRSRFFMVAPGLMNNAELTGGQVEVGFRYYEGSAAGAVLVGNAPDCETFRRAFDWPDAVIEIRPDSSDAAEVLAELAAQPDRLQEISRRNAAEALLRHDWVYRWKEILAIAGLEPTPAMVARETRLKELAELARIGHLV